MAPVHCVCFQIIMTRPVTYRYRSIPIPDTDTQAMNIGIGIADNTIFFLTFWTYAVRVFFVFF